MIALYIMEIMISVVSIFFMLCFWHLYFPFPLHRYYRYRIIKEYEYNDYFQYVVQRKLWYFGTYQDFDVERWERNDGELNMTGKQRAINRFSNLKYAEEFIPRIKQIREDEYQSKKNIKKDEVIYKD